MVGFVRRFGVLALGLAGMVGGAVLLVTRLRSPYTGYFVSAPLSDTTYLPPVDSPPIYLAVAIMVLGTALAAGWVGFRFGARRGA